MSSRFCAVTLLGCLTLIAAAPPSQGGAVPQDTWIVSGQSNACGRAALPGPRAHARALAYDAASRKWIPAQDPLPGMGSRGVGPWVAAATAVAARGVTVRMAGNAQGGRPISYWNEGAAGWRGLSGAIKSAGGRAGVFLWYQGENDGSTGMDAPTYRAALAAFVARVRKAAASPRMLVVVVQLGSWSNSRGDFMPIREAERQFVAADGNALLVSALGRTMKDYVHLDTAGQAELGGEIARALLKTRYGAKGVDWPGPVLDAAVIGRAGTDVFAHFAEAGQLRGVDAADFGVIDADGAAKCTLAQAAGRTMVALRFERPLKAPAKLVYAFGQKPKASLTDEAGNRAPAVQIDIKVAPAPRDVPTKAPNGAGRP